MLPAQLTTHTLGQQLHYVAQTLSTNTLAVQLAQHGAPAGTLVITDHQSGGRGRMGRAWQTAPGANLTFSLIVRPVAPLANWPFVGFAAAVAVARTLEQHAPGSVARVKWPNDVLLDKRKVCGFLLETARAADTLHSLVVGIGVNVNQQAFSGDVAGRATSLRLITGQRHDRTRLLAALLNAFEPLLGLCAGDGIDALLTLYSARLDALGEQVVFYETDTSLPVAGRLAGLASTGDLLLETASGMRTFRAGDLTTRSQ